MEPLWNAVQSELRDQLDDDEVVATAAYLIVEYARPGQRRGMAKMSFDADGKKLMPWDEDGLLIAALTGRSTEE